MLSLSIFFEPNKSFVNLMLSDWFRYRKIVEFGAGIGHLGKILSNKGLDITCYDLLPREEYEFPVAIQDATKYYPEGYYEGCDTLAIVARPSHGGWVGKAFLNILHSSGNCIYVGLEKNIKGDLGDRLVTRLLQENVGSEGENAWLVLGLISEVENWYLIQPEFWNEPSWVRDGGDKWHQGEGPAYFPKNDEKILDVIQAAHKEQIPAIHENLLSDTVKSGWITPDGRWFGCPSNNHDTVIHEIFGIRVGRAEELGFIRCYGMSHGRMLWSNTSEYFRVTPKQKRALDKHGYIVDDWDMRPSSTKY